MMTFQHLALLGVCVLTNACGRSASEPANTRDVPEPAGATARPATSAAAAAPAPAAVDAEAPRIAAPTRDQQLAEIRGVFQKLEADESLTAVPVKVECQGMETRLESRSFTRDGTLQKSKLAIWPPGDTSEEYSFYYDRGELVFALQQVVGYAGAYKHTSEYRYYFAGGAPLQCLKKDAKGSEAEVAAGLPLAENKIDDCKSASRALKLANAFKQGARAKEALTKLACTL